MTATNKPMTGAQLNELMAVAMRMQSDSEKMGERPVSLFAYAVQIAVLEIREVRSKYEELQSQNADMAVQLAIVALPYSAKLSGIVEYFLFHVRTADLEQHGIMYQTRLALS